MPGAVDQQQQQQQPSPQAASPKKKFGTVRGIGAAIKDSSGSLSNQISHSLTVGRDVLPLNRRGRDAPQKYSRRRKNRVQQSSATDVEFFETTISSSSPTTDSFEPFVVVENLKPLHPPHSQYPRRPPVRMDNQDGPWSVSVAETPGDPLSYSLYVKTPTHNLTLTRTAFEIVELHHKLRESIPGMILPSLPLDPVSLPPPQRKRKSNFLHTLSRLASPSSGKTHRSPPPRRLTSSSRPTSATASNLTTPVVSPTQEISDPFLTQDLQKSDSPSPNNVTITGLAAYLTTISNTADLRQSRVFKRFVRVRTDDLESVRVERAIKRVRSDLAAHVVQKSVSEVIEDAGIIPALVNGDVAAADGKAKAQEKVSVDGHDESEEDAKTTGSAPVSGTDIPPSSASASESAFDTLDAAEEQPPLTPSAKDSPLPPTNRIHRSQSADPDKSSRLSRSFAQAEAAAAAAEAAAAAAATDTSSGPPGDQTGDESSTSRPGSRRTARKKRSRSVDPIKEAIKKKSQRKVVVDDFEMMRVLGKGCAGKVLLVRHKPTSDLYALKAITKRHVLAHQELQHTLTEQAVLKRMAAEGRDPFVVKLWWSFHDKENLFLVMDFHPGGDLATQLARWGRLGRDRARFYAAEIVEGVEGLHTAGVIYRDLKPENILIGADGHIVLTDFGLSKEFPRRSAMTTAPSTPSGLRGEYHPDFVAPYWMKGGDAVQELSSAWPAQRPNHLDATSTFCGTAEYLAPEVIQGLNYSYEVDWWSFGTMLYEMLTGITPFWANNHSDMYVRVLQDDLQFPDDRAIDQDTKSLIRGLLQRNPALRMCEPRVKRHPYFSMIDWSHVYYKRYIPPYIPPIDPSNASDTQNFDDTFLDMNPVINDEVGDNEQTDTDGDRGEQTDTDRTDGEGSNATPSRSRSSSTHPRDDGPDVFDGYSFKGRHSVILDEEEEEDDEEEEEDEDGMEETIGPEVVLRTDETTPAKAPAEGVGAEEEEGEAAAEPKTPEAKPAPLVGAKPGSLVEARLVSEEEVTAEEPEAPAPPVADEGASAPPAKEAAVEEAEAKAPAVPPKPTPRPVNARVPRNRREKSGVPALDRYLSDGVDEEGDATEREEEDDDWDIVERGVFEDRNGVKGTSLFARGVVDRYRLAVFRKASPPSRQNATEDPAEKTRQHRGRERGILRRHPKELLQASKQSSMRSGKSGAFSVSSAGPSLKSKESTISADASSDQSANGDSEATVQRERGRTREERGQRKPRKLQKYKEGAEKVLSLFASPRQS